MNRKAGCEGYKVRMRKIVAVVCLEVAGIGGSTITAMIWPTIEPSIGLRILAGCLALAVVGLVVLAWPAGWIPRFRRSVGGLMTPHEVIRYLGDESRWGKRTREWQRSDRDGTPVRKNERLEAFEEFRTAAKDPDTRIRSYGRREGAGVPEAIPHTFWLTNGFSILDTLRDGQITSPTVPSGHGNTFYSDVVVERAGVVATWPRMRFLDRNRHRRNLAKQGEEIERFLASLPPEADFVPLREAAVWLYHNLSPRIRGALRRGVPSPFDTVEEHAEAFVKEAGAHGVCRLFAKWGRDLPYEEIDPSSADYDAFEAVFGSDRKLAIEVAVRRSDLPTILAYYEGGGAS